jgi:hypothetical protein
MTDLDALTLAEYAVKPAITPFSRTIIPWQSAQHHGLNSWHAARRHAREQLREEDK